MALQLKGRHRVLCGDSTAIDQVERLMDGEKADMVFTDPPYGINLATDYKSFSGKGSAMKRNTHNFKQIEGDNKIFDASFILSQFSESNEMFIWGANYFAHSIPECSGSWIVWDKRADHANLDKMHGSWFELCWSRERHQQKMARITWAGCFGHNKKNDGDSKVHPTQKPVSLAEWFFEQWGKSCNLIIDIFLGSGSTLIACEKTDRRCFGMEIDPHYCDVILERYKKFCGKEVIKC